MLKLSSSVNNFYYFSGIKSIHDMHKDNIKMGSKFNYSELNIAGIIIYKEYNK
jgi:hypothetical protein